MASQNVPGAAVLAGNGNRTLWREALGVTGLGTLLVGPAGGDAVNLAAITAALAAGPEAGPEAARRWWGALSGAATYVLLGLGAGALTAVVTAAADGVVQAAFWALLAGLVLRAVLRARPLGPPRPW